MIIYVLSYVKGDIGVLFVKVRLGVFGANMEKILTLLSNRLRLCGAGYYRHHFVAVILYRL